MSTPIWDAMVRAHGNPFVKPLDKPDSQAIQSGQRKQPRKSQPRRKR